MNDFIFFLKHGWEHIMSWDALDHLYFISVLSVIYTFQSWKKVLVLVTAFTIGHAVTLFLSALEIIRFNDAIVEFAIPCTIIASAAVNFIRKSDETKGSLHYMLALFFGLIHGMGYANAIRFMLVKGQSFVGSLLSFNLGLECGQIVVVLLMLFAGWAIEKSGVLSRNNWIMVFSAFIFSLTLQMAIERFHLIH